MVGRQLSLFAVLIPFWLVAAQAGWRGMMEVWPACLVTGASFGLTEFLVSNYHGPWLAGIASALVSMASLVPIDDVLAARGGNSRWRARNLD